MAGTYITMNDKLRLSVLTDESRCIAVLNLVPVQVAGKLINCSVDMSKEDMLSMMLVPDPSNPGCWGVAVNAASLGGGGTGGVDNTLCFDKKTVENVTVEQGGTTTLPFDLQEGGVIDIFQNGPILSEGNEYVINEDGTVTWLIPLNDCTLTYKQFYPCSSGADDGGTDGGGDDDGGEWEATINCDVFTSFDIKSDLGTASAGPPDGFVGWHYGPTGTSFINVADPVLGLQATFNPVLAAAGIPDATFCFPEVPSFPVTFTLKGIPDDLEIFANIFSDTCSDSQAFTKKEAKK